MAKRQKHSRFPAVYQQYLMRDGRNDNQLYRQSDKRLSKTTLRNWREGISTKPRHWEPLIIIAALWRLTETETNQLLDAAGFETVATLRQRAADSGDREMQAEIAKISANGGLNLPGPLKAPGTDRFFIGRGAERSAISTALRDPHGPQIICLSGMGGIGKSTLAAWIANEYAPHHFPDGVHWLSFKDGDPAGALQLLANVFQVDLSPYRSIEHKAAALRGVQAGQKFLLFIDDVEDEGVIKHLLPPIGSAKVIITSRRKDLAIMHQAVTIELQPFNDEQDESVQYFRKVMKAIADAESLRAIATLLGRHPLALSIAAHQMKSDLNSRPSRYLERLGKAHSALDRLQKSELNIRATLLLSLEDLTAEAVQLFGHLAVFAGDPFDVQAAAAVAELDFDTAEDLLGVLYSRSLVQKVNDDQVALHPLLSALAKEQAVNFAGLQIRAANYYLDQLIQYSDRFKQHDENLSHLKRAFSLSELIIESRYADAVVAAFPWLKSRGYFQMGERWVVTALDNLSQAQSLTGAALLQFQGEIAAHFGRLEPAATAYELSLHMLDQLDQTPKANQRRGRLLRRQGSLAQRQGNHAYAQKQFAAALPLFEATHDNEEILALSINQGVLFWAEGEIDVAKSHFSKGLALAEELDHGSYRALIYQNLGMLHHEQGNYQLAIDLFQGGLDWAVEHNHLTMQTRLNGSLGLTNAALGNLAQSKTYLQSGVKLAETLQNPRELIRQESNLAWLYGQREEFEVAGRLFGAIWEKLVLMPLPFEQCKIMNMWADVTLKENSDLEAARKRYEEAGQIAHSANIPKEEGQSIFGQAQIAQRSGRVDIAAELGKRALQIFKDIQHSQAENIESWLREL